MMPHRMLRPGASKQSSCVKTKKSGEMADECYKFKSLAFTRETLKCLLRFYVFE